MLAQRLAALVPRPRLLKRVFNIDIEHCPHCGGDLKIISTIEEPAVIARILTHPAHTPPEIVASESSRYGKIIRDTGAKPD